MPVPAPSEAAAARAARSGRIETRAERGRRAQSRHLIPTAAGTMQSGQIGLPQEEHETPVSTFGWLAQLATGAAPAVLDTRASVASAPMPAPSRETR